METRKNALWPAFIGQLFKNSKQLILGFLLAVVVISGFNFGGEVRVEGQTSADNKNLIPINFGGSSGYVVTGLDESNRLIYRGLIDCKETEGYKSIEELKKLTVTELNKGCIGFVLKGETVGEVYKNNREIYNSRVNGVLTTVTNRGGTILYKRSDNEYYLQNQNGVTKFITGEREIAQYDVCLITKGELCPSEEAQFSAKIAEETRRMTAINSAGQFALAQLGGNQGTLVEAEARATAMSTGGAICNVYLDVDKKPVYRCRKGITPVGPNGADLPPSCTAKTTGGDILFRYDGTTVTCDITSEVQNQILADPQNIANRQVTVDIKEEGLFDPLGAILFKIVVWVLAWLLLMIGNAALFILWALGGFVLWILAQNPGTPEFVTLLSRPWGLLAGIGNLMVLGAFLYTGFGYLLGIANMKKDLGEFIQKIIYYALILNFTLYGLATLVNVGYGLGNLIKVSYSSTAKKEDVNRQLVGSLLNGIGKVSTIRCGTHTPDCVVIDGNGKNVESNGAKAQFDKLFGIDGDKAKDEAGAITAIVMEFVAIGMMIVAGIVLWRALYTTFYRFIGILFIMMLSPIGAASLFSPIDSWQSIGKQMWDKFWKMVVFYPAFIFGLILVNLLSSQFAEVNGINNGRAGNLADTFTTLLTKIVGAGISIMGLWLITDYFAKSFEEDMNKIGSGVKSVATSAWEGAQKIGKFGNGALKLGGGTIANAGRLLSTTGNLLGAGRYYKSRANAAAKEADRLAKQLQDNVDENGNELTEEQKANKLSNIMYLRRQEDEYRDKQRRGIGRSFISAGNTIGYSGDRAVSTAKNIASYFGKINDSFKAEDDVYWQTQSNRAMKRLGLNDAADVIFSGAANVGITADAEAALAEEAAAKGLSNPFDNILNDQREDAIKGALGLKDRKLRRDVAEKLIPHLVKRAAGDLENLSQAEQRLLEQVTDLAADDEQLGRELFGKKDGSALIQQMTAKNMITDSNTATKLAENWGNTLGTQEERLSAGARLAKDQRAFEKVDKSIFNDPDVLEGYKQAMNGDLSAIGKSKGRFGSLHDNESIDAAKEFVSQIAPVTGTKEFRDKVDSATSSIQDNFRNSAFSGHQDVLHELADLHSQDLDDATFKTKSDDVMAKALAKQFGISKVNAKKLLEKNGATEVVQSADVEAMFDAKGNPGTATTMVEKLVKESDVGLYAKNNVKGFDKMNSLEQLEVIKQATLQQMVSANRNVDTYRAKANTTAVELSDAKKRGVKRAKAYETAKSATEEILKFTADKNKVPINDRDQLANIQRAIASGNDRTIRDALVAARITDPAMIIEAREIGKKAVLANGTVKMKGDLEDAFAIGNDAGIAEFLEKSLGVTENIPGTTDKVSAQVAKEIRRQAGSSATVQADLIDEFSKAMSIFSEKGGLLNPSNVNDKEAIDILAKFGVDTSRHGSSISKKLKNNGDSVMSGVAGSSDPSNVIFNLKEKHKSNAGKAYGDTLKPVKELDPDFITQS